MLLEAVVGEQKAVRTPFESRVYGHQVVFGAGNGVLAIIFGNKNGYPLFGAKILVNILLFNLDILSHAFFFSKKLVEKRAV